MTLTEKRLLSAYKKSLILPYDSKSKIVIMSDCHRGQGNEGDNFLQNQTVYFGALEYYFQENFTYIELGDGDELWENRRMKPIIQVHSDIFWMMSQFFSENRFHMIYGNHDIVKKRKSFMSCNCENYYCDYMKDEIALFPDMEIQEGIVLEDKDAKTRLFLVHGHQGSILNDVLWPVARFLVRYVWRPLELMGFLDPTGAARSRKNMDGIEVRLSSFARDMRHILIAGHTHRPVFSYPGDGFYFNDGSCVHPRCITGIEIENNRISLIKWSIRTRQDRSLYVGREVLEGPIAISEYYKTEDS